MDNNEWMEYFRQVQASHDEHLNKLYEADQRMREAQERMREAQERMREAQELTRENLDRMRENHERHDRALDRLFELDARNGEKLATLAMLVEDTVTAVRHLTRVVDDHEHRISGLEGNES